MKFVQSGTRQLLAFLFVMLAGLTGMQAQTTYGAVRGLVTDSQGGALGSAAVKLSNQGTGIVRTTATNASGEYTFTAIEPGTYSIEVTMTGFKKTENRGIAVDTGSTATIDLGMTVGGTSDTVEVSTEEPLIDSANANGGQQFSSQQLEELPNLGRNPFVFEKIDAAVTPVGDPRYVRAEDQTGQSTISVAGAPVGANNFAVDGIPISQSNGGVTFIPSLEAVSDVKVQANTYDAEVGRTGGGMFNTTLKSGTEKYHGVLYGMTRQTNWSANSFTNNQTNLVNPATGQGILGTVTPRPDVTTYLYAGAFGGPVPFSDKSKWTKNTFFWVVEEGYRQAQPLPGSGAYIVPLPAELTGDFSGDTGTTLYDPTTTTTVGTATTRQPLTGLKNGVPTANVIPASYINPIGQSIANTFPACNACGNAYNTNNYFTSDDFKTRSDMYSGKLDHLFAPWWSATLSYVHLATQEPTGSFIHTIDNADGILHRFNDATAFNNVFQVNATTVVTAGYGYNRYYSHQVPYSESAFAGGFNQATGFSGTGFPAAYVALVQSKSFPQVYVSGIGPSGSNSIGSTSSTTAGLGTSDSGPTIQSSRNVVLGVAKTIGKQSVKGGYVYRALSNFQQPLGTAGVYYFDGQYTTINGKPISSATGTGNALADLLLGQPGAPSNSVNNNTGSPELVTQVSDSGGFNQQISYHALFLQDDLRATQKLTVNVGVRYEYELGQREAKNQYAVGFDQNIGYNFPCTLATGVSSCAQAHGGLAFAGQNGYPVRCCMLGHAKFSPRIGLAYELRKGTVIRGGFGIFYAPVATVTDTTGYSQTTYSATTNNVTAPTAVGSAAPLSNPFGGAANVLPASGNTLGSLTGVGGSVSAQAFNRQYPLVEQYSVNMQHELPYGISLEVGYVGEHSKYLPQSVGINQLPNGLLSQYAAASSVSTAAVPNPYYAPTVTNGTTTYRTTGTVAGQTIAPGQLLLPYPQFAGGTGVTLIESVGYSLYNALTVKVQKRYHGLTVLSTYTWSSNWDNFYGAASAFSSSLNSTSGPQDATNLKAEYARAVNNIPNRLTAAVTYELPIGRNRKLFGDMPRILDYILGGYEINTVSILQNGSPLSITQTDLSTSSAFGVSGFGGGVQRPTLIAGQSPCYSGSPESRYGKNGTGSYFNTNAFGATPAYTYSPLPRSLACQGPGYANTDLSVNKTFSIHEKYKVQFRAEALNFTNTPEFANPGLSFTASQASPTAAAKLTPSSTTGIVQGTVGFNRIIQLGGRFSF